MSNPDSQISAEKLLENIKFLIKEAEKEGETKLAERLNDIIEYFEGKKICYIINIRGNKFLLNFLYELYDFSYFYLHRESNVIDNEVKTLSAEEYCYFTLFPHWLNNEDDNLYYWLDDLIVQKKPKNDEQYINAIHQEIKTRNNMSVFRSSITDYAMATDLIVSNKDNIICFQLTVETTDYNVIINKVEKWRKNLEFWIINKGVFFILDLRKEYKIIVDQLLTTFDNINEYGYIVYTGKYFFTEKVDVWQKEMKKIQLKINKSIK